MTVRSHRGVNAGHVRHGDQVDAGSDEPYWKRQEDEPEDHQTGP